MSADTDVRVAGRITDALHLLARHWPATANPPRVTASTTHTTPASKPPMPAAVLSLRREVRDHLAGHVRVVAQHRDLRGPGEVDVPTVTRWLAAHADWLGGNLAVTGRPARVAHDLEHLARRVREVALQQRPSTVDVGPCPEAATREEGAHCGGMLRATVRRDDDLLPSTIRCTHDPTHSWAPRQWEDLAQRVHGVVAGRAWLPVADAAAVTGVPARTVRRWVAEGRVTKWSVQVPAVVSVLEVLAVREAGREQATA